MSKKGLYFIIAINYLFFLSCKAQTLLLSKNTKALYTDTSVNMGHIGISVFEPATQKYWVQHQSNSLFVPASNIKILTLFSALQYSPKDILALKTVETDTAIFIFPTADPSFFHSDFKQNPVYEFLKKQTKPIYINVSHWDDNALGYGWAWDDYNSFYMTERSPFPIHGNYLKATLLKNKNLKWETTPPYFEKYFDTFYTNNLNKPELKYFYPERDRLLNNYKLVADAEKFVTDKLPFATLNITTTLNILKADYNIIIKPTLITLDDLKQYEINNIYSEKLDSVLKPMMQRSDNFFAEQMLLNTGYLKLNKLSTGETIDFIIKNNLANYKQPIKWVDGSGLSRYNLITPNTFIKVLDDLYKTQTFERLQNIFPTGGQGTLSNLFKKLKGNIFAKTGTLSNNTALSGYLITKQKKVLIFSFMANNFIGSPGPVRKNIEKYLTSIYENY